MSEFKERAKTLLKEGNDLVSIYTDRDNYYEISDSRLFFGMENKQGYVSEILGNCIYDDFEEIVDLTFEEINKFNEKVIDVNLI